MCLCVNQGKGSKDRYVPLSPRLLEQLREYWRRDRPQHWLFPTRPLERPMSRQTPARIYQAAKDKARIRKTGGIHTLRHAYATGLARLRPPGPGCSSTAACDRGWPTPPRRLAASHLCLQHLQTLRALPTHRQTLLPESVEFQLLPQLERQPARAPLTGTMHPYLVELDLDHFTIELWALTVRGKQRHLLCAGIRLQHVDCAAPRGFLAIVDFRRDRTLGVARHVRRGCDNFRRCSSTSALCRP